MSVQVLVSRDGKMAALYDSSSLWAFGPVFTGEDAAEHARAFLHWLHIDPRMMTDAALEKMYWDWRQAQDEKETA